ncbi:hypothetical protein NFI96_025540 [Prochilodus magdalenae]|nr:hypothetical protein NFI96_025540 [Prochilodus magdalenae]
MAEADHSTHQEDNAQKSPTSPNSGALKAFVRTFSIQHKTREENKSREKEIPEIQVTSPESDAKSPDTPDSSAKDIFQQKMSIIRKSFRDGKKALRKKLFSKSDPTEEGSVEGNTSLESDQEFSDSFITNIPPKPLSVLQIDEHLKSEHLEEAYPNLLSLRQEFQREQEALGEKSAPVELVNKEKDLSMLYETLRKKLTDIVRQSCDRTSKGLLMNAVYIIQEEEKREGQPGGMKGWMDAWRAAVQDGVRDTIKGVQLDSHESEPSWLAVHLGLLGKANVEHLEKVKTEFVGSYPESFNVFETYASAWHELVGKHLKELLKKVTELKDYYAMLDFTTNSYHSEKILGNPSLQPEMKLDSLIMPDDFLDQIKNKYCNCLQEDFNAALEKIIHLEQEELWKKKGTPQRTEDGILLTNNIHMDICTLMATYAKNSEKIDITLEKKVLCSCLKALKPFLKRFEEEFTKQSSSLLGSDLLDCCLWAEYHVSYINSFSSLKEQLENYRADCPDQVDQLVTEINNLVLRLRQTLLDRFKEEIEPYKDNLMTKKWLNTDDDFKEIINRIESYSGYSKSMKPPSAQTFASDLHYHVVKEYISELLKNKYSCKGRKNDNAAIKIAEQWDEFNKLFSDMGSTLDWLHPLGAQLSQIIEQEHEKDIKNLLVPLVENYPDISEKQLSAILGFRDKGIVTYSKMNPVIRHFTELKQNLKTSGKKSHDHILFSDIKKKLANQQSFHDADVPRKPNVALKNFTSLREHRIDRAPERPVEERRNRKRVSDLFICNIPDKALSVQKIHELLQSNSLKEAYLNLLSLRLEIQREREALSEKTPIIDLTTKEKDLSQLCETLRKKLTDIVRHSCNQTSKELLMHAAHIIHEEEKREGDPGGMKGWMDAWRAAVQDGVRDTLEGVQLDSRESNISWLAVHLGLLGKAIVEHLEKVKTEFVDSYPESFNVFETYVSAWHELVGKHLKELLEKVTEFKDYYAMLEFTTNSYHSEKVFGSPLLQPEMKEQNAPALSEDFLDQIRKKFCNCLQESLHASFGNIIQLEQEEVWQKKKLLQNTDDGGFITSEIHIDILGIIAQYAETSRKIDINLEKRVLGCCLETLRPFPKRFEGEFSQQKPSFESNVLDLCLWAKYHVGYINSFSSLKENIERYKAICPDQEDRLKMEIDNLVLRLRRDLLKQFKTEIEPYQESLMTKKWLNTDDDFKQIINRIESYSGYSKSMKPLPAQSFASDLHGLVVKEYISELLKKKYSCKGKKNDLGAAKIKDQWDQLSNLFQEMGSTLNWLHPLGEHLSKIIEQKKEKDIKNLLPSFVENFPDISKPQFLAILHFRDKGFVVSFKNNMVIQYFTELQQQQPEIKTDEHILFSDIK